MPGKVFAAGTRGSATATRAGRREGSLVWAHIAKFNQNGSEPSLVSANGQRSSDSKRNLHSGEPVSSLKHGTSDIPSRQQCKSDNTLDKVDSYPASWGRDSRESTPNTPSYVRLSCSVSGYGHRYGTVSPDREPSKLRVIKKSTPPPAQSNGSSVDETDHSVPLLHQENSPLVNGYLPDSNGHLSVSPLNGDAVIHSKTELSQSKSGKTRYLTSIKVRPSSLSASLSSCSMSSAELEREQSESLIDNHELSHRLESVAQCSESADKLTELLSETHTQSNENAEPLLEQNSVSDVCVSQQNVVSGESLKLDLTVEEEEPVLDKNGRYFLGVVQRTEDHLNARCEQVEKDLTDQSLSEEVLGKLRAAIGKANLLMSKKFKQFRGLCEQNLKQTGEEQFITTSQDLAGFWDMVLIQVEDVDALFKEIEQLRSNGWKEVNSPSISGTAASGRPEKTHVRQSSSGSASIQLTPRGISAGSKGKSPRGKDNPGESTSQSDRAAKAKEAARIREEARKRLMAAKRAGRKRVASQSDNTEIEIYAPE